MTETTRRELPNGWRWVKLRELLKSMETGTRPKGGTSGITSGVPSLSAEHIVRSGKFDFTNIRYVPRDFYYQMSRGRIRPSDILIVKDGATTGKAAFVDENFPFAEAVINEHVFLCRPDSSEVFPLFLFLYLWSSEGQSAIRKNFQGAAIGGINQSFAEAVYVPLPPLIAQRRIAAILSKQLAVLDKCRTAAEEQLTAAKALPSAYLLRAFTTEEARLWPKRQLGEVCRLLPAHSIATNGDTEVLAITTACLAETGFQPAGVKTARMWAKDVPECKIAAGEVLVARSNTPDLVGRVAMFEGEPAGAVASDLTIRLFPADVLESPFLTMYLSSLYLSGYWKTRAGGASGSMKKITRGQLESEQIPLPPLPVQSRVTSWLRERMSGIKSIQDVLQMNLNTINRLPTPLLRRAFNGEL